MTAVIKREVRCMGFDIDDVKTENQKRIAKICAESNCLVEEGTILFLIHPE